MALVRTCKLHLHVSHITTVWLAYIRRKWSQRGVRSKCWATEETWLDWRLWQLVLSTCSGPQPACCLGGTGGLNCRGVGLIPHFHLVPMLRMCGVRVHSPIHLHGVHMEFNFFLIQFNVTEPRVTTNMQGTCFKGLIQGQNKGCRGRFLISDI